MTARASAVPGGSGDEAGQERMGPELAALIALEEPARDGRVARGQRTRRNVAEALMELLRAGETDPTAKAVALARRCLAPPRLPPLRRHGRPLPIRGRAAAPSPVVGDAPAVPPAVAADPHRTN